MKRHAFALWLLVAVGTAGLAYAQFEQTASGRNGNYVRNGDNGALDRGASGPDKIGTLLRPATGRNGVRFPLPTGTATPAPTATST